MNQHHLEGDIDFDDAGDFIDVHLDGKWLDPRPSQTAWNHSPDGFQWGYGGSGPAQLALAVLMRLMSQHDAIHYHQSFKWWLISKLPFNEDFDVTFDLDAFLAEVEEKSNG